MHEVCSLQSHWDLFATTETPSSSAPIRNSWHVSWKNIVGRNNAFQTLTTSCCIKDASQLPLKLLYTNTWRHETHHHRETIRRWQSIYVLAFSPPLKLSPCAYRNAHMVNVTTKLNSSIMEKVTEPKLSFEKQAWKTIAVKRNVLQKARIFESQIPLVKAKYIMGLLLLQRVGLL